MRCEYCPLSDPEDVCPEAEGEYGIEFKDGSIGCRHPRNWVDKRDQKYTKYLGDMGLDMGIEMTFSDEELKKVIGLCGHMIGLDYSKAYWRHGKAFYKAYRNYYSSPPSGNALLDKLPQPVIKRIKSPNGVWYKLTRTGLEWLGRQLKITIKEIE